MLSPAALPGSRRPVPLRPSLKQMAYLRFLYDFASAQEHGMPRGGALDRIPHMMSASSADSWFHCAISALSLANFGGRLRSQEAKDAGLLSYNTALGRFSSAMSSPGGTRIKTDEALLGIFLLLASMRSVALAGSTSTAEIASVNPCAGHDLDLNLTVSTPPTSGARSLHAHILVGRRCEEGSV